jgi:plastocyanin
MTIFRAFLSIMGASLVLAGVAGADGSELQGSVGPGFAISLTGSGGAAVTHLDPGSYTFVVTDKSNEHNFHLQGPGGVNVSTGVDEVGTKTLAAKLVDGKYTYICDLHPTLMAGDFTVGTPPADPTPTPKPTPKPPAGRRRSDHRARPLEVRCGEATRSRSRQVDDRRLRRHGHLAGEPELRDSRLHERRAQALARRGAGEGVLGSRSSYSVLPPTSQTGPCV